VPARDRGDKPLIHDREAVEVRRHRGDTGRRQVQLAAADALGGARPRDWTA
jgi:hypothetical protein